MTKKIVTIQMDKERHIKYGFNALIALEQELGRPITSLGDGEFSMKDLRSMFYVGLKWEDKDLTYDAVGDAMDSALEENGIDYLSAKLSEALQGATGGSAAIPSK
jgi:hypothetical protein